MLISMGHHRQKADLSKKLDSQSHLKEAEAFVPGRTAENIHQRILGMDVTDFWTTSDIFSTIALVLLNLPTNNDRSI